MIARGSISPHLRGMPTRERALAFIQTIERGQFLEAIPLFYAEDMTARENSEPPRIGRQAQVDNETRALSVFQFHRIRAVSFAIDGDVVAIHWDFGITTGAGVIDMEEIAYQTWRGDRIVSERYFYDPAQRTPRAPGA